MHERIQVVLLAGLGLGAVACLILTGTDVRRAASRGPRWRRRLLCAGLAALGWLAPFAAPCTLGGEPRAEAGADPARTPSRDDRLAASEKWNLLSALMTEAREIAAGRRGDYPFDEAAKRRLLEEISGASGPLEFLATGGLLTRAEAGLLKQDFEALSLEVRGFQPFESMLVCCYGPPLPFDPIRFNAEALRKRLDLLRNMAMQGTLSAKVVRLALVEIDARLAELERLGTASGSEADDVRRQVADVVAVIRNTAPREAAAGPETPLDRHPAWGRFLQAKDRATELLASAGRDGRLGEADRQSALRSVEAARGDLEALAGDEVLTSSEAGALESVRAELASDLGRLRSDGSSPPREFVDPAAVVRRFVDLVPLLRGLAAQASVRAEVRSIVLGHFEAFVSEFESCERGGGLRREVFKGWSYGDEALFHMKGEPRALLGKLRSGR